VDALEAAGRVKLAQADKAAADARAVAASARKQADALLTARLNGANACERAEDVRRRFEEAVP
jgi:predicted RNA-binding protein associated with RNAse of E/G family